jgi:hypothetical protein
MMYTKTKGSLYFITFVRIVAQGDTYENRNLGVSQHTSESMIQPKSE